LLLATLRKYPTDKVAPRERARQGDDGKAKLLGPMAGSVRDFTQVPGQLDTQTRSVAGHKLLNEHDQSIRVLLNRKGARYHELVRFDPIDGIRRIDNRDRADLD